MQTIRQVLAAVDVRRASASVVEYVVDPDGTVVGRRVPLTSVREIRIVLTAHRVVAS